MKISPPDLLGQITLPDLESRRNSSPAGANIFSKVLAEVNGLQSQADAKIRESLLGKADLHETMLSLERAGLGLKVLLQTRNKMLQAYEELSRMNM
jgi:flagellar hook-basal body complex protein FliE